MLKFKDDDIFKVIIPLNNGQQVDQQVSQQVEIKIDEKIINAIIEYCKEPKARKEIQEHVGLKDRAYFQTNILNNLIEKGIIEMTIKEHPNSRFQKYVVVKKGD